MANVDNTDILFKTDKITLLNNNGLFFIENSNTYNITSQPNEPCLYVELDNKIIRIIHNSFTVAEIIDAAKAKNKIMAVSGVEYDIKGICELLSCAINSNIYDTDIAYLEKKMAKEKQTMKITNTIEKQIKNESSFSCTCNIKELTDDVFYKEYKKYDECVLDYCIIKIYSKYNQEKSHKEAVIFAMEKWKKLLKYEYDLEIYYNTDKMKANKIEVKDFFEIASKDYNKNYLSLFLNPPHGTHYTIDDFTCLNNILFPNGYDNLEIYNWSTDWSNYFDEGLEWWGAKCVSIYDKRLDRFVVIGASATD